MKSVVLLISPSIVIHICVKQPELLGSDSSVVQSCGCVVCAHHCRPNNWSELRLRSSEAVLQKSLCQTQHLTALCKLTPPRQECPGITLQLTKAGTPLSWHMPLHHWTRSVLSWVQRALSSSIKPPFTSADFRQGTFFFQLFKSWLIFMKSFANPRSSRRRDMEEEN